MSNRTMDISELTPKQRAVLELKLKRMDRFASKDGATPDAGNSATAAPRGEDENLVLARGVESVDEILSKFYGRFPWPWQAMKFDYLDDSTLETVMLNQDIGDWAHSTIPVDGSVWVAGCGTNQAIQTALKYRKAAVIASDVSARSLEICANNAKSLGISNLELRQESINHVGYENQFDHVICTGVIHHNAEPGNCLARLGAALKPHGVIEMMVYNRYHRIATSSFQKAIRVFSENKPAVDFESELGIAKKIVDNIPVKDILEKAFIQYMDWSESDFADLLIQPVEHSYTVESLEEMAEACGLEMQAPCVSLYAKSLAANISWNLEFRDAEIQNLYDALPDTRRWQVTNLLLQEKSPLVWFYLKRKDAAQPRKTERQVCEEFLDSSFVPIKTNQRSYIRQSEGMYSLSPNAISFPLTQPDSSVADLFELMNGELSMRDAFRRLGIEPTFQAANHARLRLATSAFPYLKAASSRPN